MLSDWIAKNKEEFRDSFFELCSENKNNVQVKRLFITNEHRITSEVLEYGLTGAVLAANVDGQTKILETIFDMADKLDVKLQGKRSLNIAVQKGNVELIKFLDKHLNILEKELKTNYDFDLYEGRVSYGYSCGGEEPYRTDLEKKLDKYDKNIFKFSSNSQSEIALQYLLKNFKIDSNLLDESFISGCENKLMKSIMVFLTNDEIYQKVIFSELIKTYLNEPTQNADVKKEIKSLIDNINLKNALSENLEEKPQKSSLKI